MKKYGLFVFMVFVLNMPDAYAQTDKMIPFVSLKQEYTDNVTFSSSNETEDFISTCIGGLTVSHKSETVQASLTGQIFHMLYWDNDALDATDGSVNASINHQLTERFGLGASADYREDSRRDVDADTTGLILNGDRKQANGALSSSMVFSELMRGELTAGYGMTEVEQLNISEDNDSYQLSLAFVRNLSRTFDNTTGLFNISYLHYTSEYETYSPGTLTHAFLDYESDVIQAYAGFSRSLTELYSFYLQAGASYTDTKENKRIGEVRDPEQSNSSVGGVLLSGVDYDGLYWDVGLSLSHDVRGGTGSNGTVERSSISLNLDRKVSDEFSFSLATSCYLNKNERSTRADLEELTINVQPGFRYRFSDTFSLSGMYRYTLVDDRQTNTNSQRNLVYLLLRKNFDL
ncbi:MAG: hypothetical protein KKE62_18545 [Proteobacteria bacterium]|nr:hypothetical protein [Pseudomonadota bacterium]